MTFGFRVSRFEQLEYFLSRAREQTVFNIFLLSSLRENEKEKKERLLTLGRALPLSFSVDSFVCTTPTVIQQFKCVHADEDTKM